MCTLIAFHRVWEDWPLVVATNRDEAYERPAGPPRWLDREPHVLVPLDERAGGTWMGANAAGLWLGVTNRHRGDVDPARRSRGLLCLDLLACCTAGEAADRISALDEPYNPFHLVAADGEELRHVEYEVGAVESRSLPPGVHVVTNRPLAETAEEPKAGRVGELLEAADLWPLPPGSRAPGDLEDRLGAILADHGRRGPDAVCLHGGRYGTRSAAVWRVRPPATDRPAATRLAFADGPPCATPFVDLAPG